MVKQHERRKRHAHPPGGHERRAGHALQQRAQDQQATAHLLHTAPKFVKPLGTFTSGGSLGNTTRIVLNNVGLTASVLLRVSVTYTVATANATLSPKGAYAIINRLRVTDYDSQDRMAVSGHHLAARNGWRLGANYGQNYGPGHNVFTDPNVPLTIGAGNVATFFLEVPIVADLDRGDLRGLMLTQSGVGEVAVNIEWAGNAYGNADDDKLFNGSGTTVISAVSMSVDAWQIFYLPQAEHGAVHLPHLSMLTVYALDGGVRTSTDFALGQEKLWSLPNLREVIGEYYTYRRNSILPALADDMSLIKLVANGSTVITSETDQVIYYRQRKHLKADYAFDIAANTTACRGVYSWDHKNNPIRTWLFGNIQRSFTPKTAPTGVTELEVTYESFYRKGTVLPGLGNI